jgi:hypothetical protein
MAAPFFTNDELLRIADVRDIHLVYEEQIFKEFRSTAHSKHLCLLGLRAVHCRAKHER